MQEKRIITIYYPCFIYLYLAASFSILITNLRYFDSIRNQKYDSTDFGLIFFAFCSCFTISIIFYFLFLLQELDILNLNFYEDKPKEIITSDGNNIPILKIDEGIDSLSFDSALFENNVESINCFNIYRLFKTHNYILKRYQFYICYALIIVTSFSFVFSISSMNRLLNSSEDSYIYTYIFTLMIPIFHICEGMIFYKIFFKDI